MPQQQIIVAIDGPSASGKGTLARNMQQWLCRLLRRPVLCLDSGALYRALTYYHCVLKELNPEIPEHLGSIASGVDKLVLGMHSDGRVSVIGQDVTEYIRTPEVGRLTPLVAGLPEVRHKVNGWLRERVADQVAVVEGRDIGTVVFPLATVKIWLDADPQERAVRRHATFREAISVEKTDQDLRRRDEADRNHTGGEAIPADDAVHIDTTGLTPEQVLAVAKRLCRKHVDLRQNDGWSTLINNARSTSQ